MNYNTKLQTNNGTIQDLIDAANALPDAPASVEQATPTITVNSSGLITANTTQGAGYVNAGTKSSTYQLAFQPAKTITPSTTNQVAVSSGYYTGGAVTVAGDSNLVAGNIKSGTSIFGITGTYEGSGGNSDVEDSLITRTVTTYTNDRVATIGAYTFGSCTSLTSVSFPACTTISGSAFYNCTSLTSVSFPKCTTIGSSAFGYCSRLTSVSFPACTTINYWTFGYCSRLTSVSFPVCTTISGSAFYNCTSLTSVSFPKCITIGQGAFQSCTSLTSVSFPACTTISTWAFDRCSRLIKASFPKCTTIGSSAFGYCTSLTSVSFPACTTIGPGAFSNCSRLTSVSFPKCTSINQYAFWFCSKLTSICLIGSSVCTLSNSNAFSVTGIWSNKGSIFVPSSLLTSYKAATNWTFFSNRIYGI